MSKEMPKGFPPFTLHVMRALAVVEASQPDRLSESIAALYKAMWVDTKPIAEPAVFESVLAEVLGKEGAKTIVEQVCCVLNKNRLFGRLLLTRIGNISIQSQRQRQSCKRTQIWHSRRAHSVCRGLWRPTRKV
jgi:hypothetical protein